jgi:hypothetical protein
MLSLRLLSRYSGRGWVRVISKVESRQQFEITLILTFSRRTGRRNQIRTGRRDQRRSHFTPAGA